MTVHAEFIPKHFEKALDVARHIATFALLEFKADSVRIKIVDPAKVMYMDINLFPTTYKIDQETSFGVNLAMLYKLMHSLDNNEMVEIDADESKMALTQIGHRHEIAHQPLQYDIPTLKESVGPVVKVQSKIFQKYIRALSNVAPVMEVTYEPLVDTMFLEGINSIYRTLFTLSTEGDNEAWPQTYKNRFVLKFIESAINPGLADFIELHLGESICITYERDTLKVAITVANYTEG